MATIISQDPGHDDLNLPSGVATSVTVHDFKLLIEQPEGTKPVILNYQQARELSSFLTKSISRGIL